MSWKVKHWFIFFLLDMKIDAISSGSNKVYMHFRSYMTHVKRKKNDRIRVGTNPLWWICISPRCFWTELSTIFKISEKKYFLKKSSFWTLTQKFPMVKSPPETREEFVSSDGWRGGSRTSVLLISECWTWHHNFFRSEDFLIVLTFHLLPRVSGDNFW